MHPSLHAISNPGHPAVIMAGGGDQISFGELEKCSNQGANLFRHLGLRPGDTVAFCMENSPAFFEIAWAAQRSGLYFVCLSTKLQAAEVDYILQDSGAKLLVVSASLADLARALAPSCAGLLAFAVGGYLKGYRDFIAERDAMPTGPIADEGAGYDMLYSSGTTGKPKGIRPKPITGAPITDFDPTYTVAKQLYGADENTVYLCPAPIYHAAPLRWCMSMMRLGATIVLMDRFDPETSLMAIERYHVTIAQFVPTHFIRMLRLPASIRAAYDLSSLKVVIHAAAPCPIPVKEAMFDWLGPIIYEYYSGSEGLGGTFIGPQEWLMHKGSVGRPMNVKIHICDDDGFELPPRSEGTIYFESDRHLEYHNDPEKTRAAKNRHGWATLGDVGWIDEHGYLYLTDRKSFMIISGGVNIYPQEIENLLATHPKVADVAVIGAPDPEMGERVVAVVQPLNPETAGAALAEEIIAFARAGLSHVKVPRQIDFLDEIPREANGKLYKRLLRDRYWAANSQPPS